MIPRRTIRCQAAIVEGRLVALLQVSDRFSGETFWVFPGGGTEGEETPEETVRREMREEMALEVAVVRFLFATPEPHGGVYETLHTYLCRIESGEATPGVEPEVDTTDHAAIRQVGWFDLDRPESWPDRDRPGGHLVAMLETLRAVLGSDH